MVTPIDYLRPPGSNDLGRLGPRAVMLKRTRQYRAVLAAVLAMSLTGCAYWRKTLYDPPFETLKGVNVCPQITTSSGDLQKARSKICEAQSDYQRAIYAPAEISDNVWSF